MCFLPNEVFSNLSQWREKDWTKGLVLSHQSWSSLHVHGFEYKSLYYTNMTEVMLKFHKLIKIKEMRKGTIRAEDKTNILNDQTGKFWSWMSQLIMLGKRDQWIKMKNSLNRNRFTAWSDSGGCWNCITKLLTLVKISLYSNRNLSVKTFLQPNNINIRTFFKCSKCKVARFIILFNH